MSDAFFSTSELLHDRKFLFSLVFSGAATITVACAAVVQIHREKISVEPIVNVEFVAPPASAVLTRPISEISATSFSRPASAGAPAANVWSGYVIDLQKFCAAGIERTKEPSVVIFGNRGGLKVGTMELSARTCELAKSLGKGDIVFAASDTPFPDAPSEKRFVAVNATQDSF